MSKRKIDIEKREKKKLLIIRKAFEYFKYFAVLMGIQRKRCDCAQVTWRQ